MRESSASGSEQERDWFGRLRRKQLFEDMITCSWFGAAWLNSSEILWNIKNIAISGNSPRDPCTIAMIRQMQWIAFKQVYVSVPRTRVMSFSESNSKHISYNCFNLYTSKIPTHTHTHTPILDGILVNRHHFPLESACNAIFSFDKLYWMHTHNC